MKKFNLLFACTLFFISFSILAQEKGFISKQDSTRIIERLNVVESQKANFEEFNKNARESLENKFSKYENDIDRNFIIGGGCLSIIIIMGSYGFLVFIPNRVKKEVEDRIVSVVETEKEKIISIIKDYDFESKVQKESKILLLSNDNNESDKIMKFFTKLDFVKVSNKVFSDSPAIIELIRQSDLVVINNINNSISDDTLEKIINANNSYSTCFVYYGIFNKILAGKTNVNFTNSEFTIYARVIETLKIQCVLLNKLI